jgi:hypothetical protein
MFASVLTPEQVQQIRSLGIVKQNLTKVLYNNKSHKVAHFKCELSDDIKASIKSALNVDLTNETSVHIHWASGDGTDRHGIHNVSDDAYMVFLTTTDGQFSCGNDTYTMTQGTGFKYNRSVNHVVSGSGYTPRLVLGPFNEAGKAVGI